MDTPNRVVDGVSGASEYHGRTLNGSAHNIAGNYFPFIIKPLAVLRLFTALHTVIQIKHIRSLGQTYLTGINGTAHDSREPGFGFEVDDLCVRSGLHQTGIREYIIE